jgi:hypothetical protein
VTAQGVVGGDPTKLSVAGGTLTGSLGVAGVVQVNGGGGTNRDLDLGTSLRWTIRADNTAEAGANAGSNLQFIRYDDTGSALDAPIFINRSTGCVGICGATNPQAQIDVGGGTGTITVRANRGSSASTFVSYVVSTSGTDQWAIQLRNDSTNDLHVANLAQGGTGILIESRATAPNLSLLTATKSYGGGVGVVYVPTASTLPTTNPTGGGILYVDAGALKWRGPSGTVTTIGAA